MNKEKLVKIGKTVLTAIIGAGIGIGLFIGISVLKKNEGSVSSED